MNKRKKYTTALASSAFLFTLTACTNPFISTSKVSSSSVGTSASTGLSSSSTGLSSSSTTSSSSSSDPNPGYIKKDIDYCAINRKSSYAPSKGKQKALVILVSFSDGYYSITDGFISKINKYYFGAKTDTPYNWNSLSTYYSTASFGKLELTGKVTAVYNATVTSQSIKTSDRSLSDLYSVYDDAISSIQAGTLKASDGSTINLADFDNNNDNFIDSPTFITNVYDDKIWGSTFWPHMSNAEGEGEKKHLFGTYSSTNMGHITDNYSGGARTAIHEQGHVFGLDDYYDYSDAIDENSTQIDLIGGADMQDNTVFDWNPYSKMLMDWVNPYVIDGTKNSVTLTIEPGSTSGDCVLIPANYSTWNGTPYDEYLLLELFTPNGNNELDWKSWKSSYSADLGFGGIRLYHVDSCLYGYSDTDTLGAWIDDPKNTTYTETETFCNSRLAKDYGYTHLPKEDADCHQIQLIQAGKVNTFGSTDETVNHTLTSADLFKSGDKFTFSGYKDFFPKETTMDNGEDFNYTIDFKSVTSFKATINITLNN